MADLDLSAIISGLFLPMLGWTGSVIVVSLSGYPGVVCMTPVAWLLALPLGMRVRRESHSLGRGPLVEAAIGGAFLGFWQGALLAAVIAASPYLPGKILSATPDPLFTAIFGVLISVPVTAGLAVLMAKVTPRNDGEPEP